MTGFIKRIARVLAGASAAAMLFLFAGCDNNFMPASGEITSFEIVRVLGIDKSAENPDDVEVTLIAERAKPSPGEEGGGMSYEVMSAVGPTAFEAVSRLRATTDKRQVFGYVDYIIFGEETVKDDFSKYADFPAGNPEIRYSPKVFIARETTAKELLNTTSSGDMYIGDGLDNLSKNVNIRSDFSLVRNIELMNMLDKKDAAAVIPAIEAKKPEGEKLIEGELPDKKLSVAGYAVIRDFKLAGYFDVSEARGYNFLTDGVKSCSYSVRDDAGAYTGLDVLSEGLSIKPRWNGNTLTGITYVVHLNANIAERRSLDGAVTRAAFTGLSGRLEDAVEEELLKTAAKSKEFGIDCFGLGERLRMLHPYKWRELEGSWREVYNNLEIKVEAEAVVRRVYDLREPSGYGRS